MRNIHLYPRVFSHESRIMKEAVTLSSRLGFDEIDLVGVKAQALLPVQAVTDHITIHRLGPSKGRGLMKVLRHMMWCLHVLWFSVRRRPDAVNCHSLPTLPIGLALKILIGAKLVYDAHELETETDRLHGPAKYISKIIERFCIRWVDLLIVVSPGIERWYRQNLSPRAVATVLNAPSYREPLEGGGKFREAFPIKTDERIILYQGHLGPHRGIEELVAAAPALRDRGCRVVVMGFGPLEAELRKKAEGGTIFLHPAVSQDVLLEYTSSADVGVHLIQDTCLNHHLCLPNKLFEYIMARLPIVASGVPEIKRLVEEHSIGACTTKWDSDSVVAAISKVLDLSDNAMRERLDKIAKIYNWQVQEEIIVASYKDLICGVYHKQNRT